MTNPPGDSAVANVEVSLSDASFAAASLRIEISPKDKLGTAADFC